MKLHLSAAHVAKRASVVLISLASTSAWAGHDWTMTEETDLILQTPVCRAATTVAKDVSPKGATTPAALPAEISFSFPKDATILPIAYVKIAGLSNKAEIAQLRFSKKEFQPLFLYKAAATPQEPDVYWYAPKDLTRWVEQVRDGQSIDIVFDPKATKPAAMRFSVSGARRTLDDVTKCAKIKTLLPTEFLKALNAKTTFTGQLPAQVTAEELQTLVQKAYRDYLDGKTAAQALAALRRAMKPLTDKEAVALHDLSGKQKTLDGTTKTLNARLQDRQDLNDEVAKFTADLQNAQNDKPLAEQDLAAKKAVYDPLKATLAPFEKDLADKTASLKRAKHNVAADEERIDDDINSIASLRGRASSLRSEISSLQSDLSSADSALSRARSDLNSFNYSWTKQRYLDQGGYSSAKSQGENYERQACRAEDEARRAQGELSSAQSQAASCHSQANANCSSQDSAVSTAANCFSQAQSRASSARSQASYYQSQAQQIERDACSRADSDKSQLENAYSSAQSRYNGIANDLSSDESALSNIVNSQIPSYQNDLAHSRNMLPGLKATQAAAEQDLAVSSKALTDERAAIGFDPVEKAYFDAIARRDTDVKTIADRTSGIAKDGKSLVKLEPVITKLQTTTAKQTVIRDASAAKLAPIQTALAPQRAQEAAVLAQIDTAKTGLADGRALYQAEYVVLAGRVGPEPLVALEP